MKLRLLVSLIAVLTVATGLHALVGEVVQGAGDVVAGVGEGISNLGEGLSGRRYYRDGYYYDGYARPVEQVTTTTYRDGFFNRPVKRVTTTEIMPVDLD